MGPLRVVFCSMPACFGARAPDARRGRPGRARRGGAEMRLAAPDELPQRGGARLLAAPRAPAGARGGLEGRSLEIVRCRAPLLRKAQRPCLESLVGAAGLEPARACARQPLKLARLPVPPRPDVVRCRCLAVPPWARSGVGTVLFIRSASPCRPCIREAPVRSQALLCRADSLWISLSGPLLLRRRSC